MFNLKDRPLLQLSLQGVSFWLMVACLLFISAGNTYFPEIWLFLIVFSIIPFFFFLWLYKKNRRQLYNRLKLCEPDSIQQKLVFLIGFFLCSSLIISGLHLRFGFIRLTKWRYLLAGILLTLSILIYVNVFKRNPFLSSTVEIHEGQFIVSTGMYSIVRHPMYLATILTCASGMIILGSLFNIPLLLAIIYLINTRINYEEKQLIAVIPDYADYVGKVKHKLNPIALLQINQKHFKKKNCNII